MTARETERLAKVEQKVDDVKDDVSEIKDEMKDMNKKIDDFITAANGTFLTVAQAKLIGYIIGLLLTISGIGVALLNYYKGH